MKFAILDKSGKQFAVLMENNAAFPLPGELDGLAFQALLADPERLSALGTEAKRKGEVVDWTPDQLAPPVVRPRKILGIGLNYFDHAAETGRTPPTTQTWFVKQVTSLNRPFGDVALPAVSDHLDYEVELVVVIGRGGRHIPADRAHEVIAGYTVGCDYSVRDWQKATPTMIMGKGFDTHAPIGPWLMTADEVGELDTLRLTTHVNGEKRQDEVAGKLIHKVPALIAHLSAAFTLEPGDLIFTGTPAGVAMAGNPPNFLKTGDKVRVGIDRIGSFENLIVPENAQTRIGG